MQRAKAALAKPSREGRLALGERVDVTRAPAGIARRSVDVCICCKLSPTVRWAVFQVCPVVPNSLEGCPVPEEPFRW